MEGPSFIGPSASKLIYLREGFFLQCSRSSIAPELTARDGPAGSCVCAGLFLYVLGCFRFGYIVEFVLFGQ